MDLISAFELKPCEIALQRLAQPGTPFDKCGRRFALLAEESGSFEAWAYPLKILRGFNFSFYIGESTRPILAKDIVRFIEVTPEATILTYHLPIVHGQSHIYHSHQRTRRYHPAGRRFYKSPYPSSAVFSRSCSPCGRLGLGGQFAYWNNDLKAYVISESSGKNHGLVGSPAASGLSYTPAHMLSDAPSEFRIPDPGAAERSKINSSLYVSPAEKGRGNQ